METAHRDWIRLEDIARLEGVPYKTVQKRFSRARARSKTDEADARRRLYPITVLSPEARNAWLSEQASLTPPDSGLKIADPGTTYLSRSPEPNSRGPEAATGVGQTSSTPMATIACAPASTAGASSLSQSREAESGEPSRQALQPVLPFEISVSRDARAQAMAAIPERFQPYVAKWMGIVADCTNGTFRRSLGYTLAGVKVDNNDDYRHALAKMHDVSYRMVYQKLALFRSLKHDPEIPAKGLWKAFADALVPKARPGRSGHTFFDRAENDWMLGKLHDFYLNQAKLSYRAAHGLLLDEIRKKRAAWGVGHQYDEPTLDQSITALRRLSKPQRVLGREGDRAFYNQCAPFISRKPPEVSNFVWCTDQKVADVRVQDAGHRLGRLTSVNFIDITSNKWLGCCFTPVLSSDTVMRAATDAMIRTGTRPQYVQFDLGKEFYNHRFGGGVLKIKGETLFHEALGMWQRLGVEPVKAIGNNPRTKPIERWHAELRKLDQQFISYTGKRPDDRPERLAKIEAQHWAWLAGEAENPGIPTIEEYIDRFCGWCAVTWNLETRSYGRYLQGMTPEECWNAKRPPQGFPRISEDEINYQTCERREEQVSTGGQINIQIHGQRLEYIADELFALQGERVEVLLSRISYRTVTVIYPIAGGTGSCVAAVKEQYDWVPEGEDAQERMRAAIRAQHRVKRAVKAGLEASGIASEASNPMEVLEVVESLPPGNPLASRGVFGNVQPPAPSPQHPETGSVEWMARGRRRGRETSEEAADEVWKLMKAEG